VDLLAADEPRAPFLTGLGLDPTAPTVGLLPGSRPNEVRRLLPVLRDAAALVAARVPAVQFVVARAPRLDDDLFAPMAGAERRGLRVALVSNRTDAVLSAADVVITASGTATVQTALHETPMVIVYKLSPTTYRLGIRFVRVDTYGMVNLVAGERLVPELIQDACTPAAVADATLGLLTDPARAAAMRSALADVRHRLGEPGASRRAAAAVLEVARGGDGLV
jgi:lipid-A-disaccharide synthase